MIMVLKWNLKGEIRPHSSSWTPSGSCAVLAGRTAKGVLAHGGADALNGPIARNPGVLQEAPTSP